MTDANLANRIDIWGFENGCMVFKDLSLGLAFKLSTLDISCQTDESINVNKELFRNFLNGLPPDLSLQIVQEIVSGNDALIDEHLNQTVESANPFVKELTQKRVDSFKRLDESAQLPIRNLYLFVRLPFEKKIQSGFFKKRANFSTADLEKEIVRIKKVGQDIAAGLSILKISAKLLNESETFQLIYNQWNPDRLIAPQNVVSHDIRDQIALTDVVIGIDGFRIGKAFHRVISLKLLPEQTFASMAEVLNQLPFDSRLHLSIETLDQQKEISALQLQRRMTFSQASGAKGVSDLDAQAKLRDLEDVLAQMIQGSEKIFRMSLQVILRSFDEDELDAQVSETLRIIRSLSGAEALLETYATFDIFRDVALPNSRSKERMHKVTSSILSDFLPIFSSHRGFSLPRVLLRNSDGGFFSFDPFSKSLTNFNQIVSGGSGSGKSFLTQVLLFQMLKEAPAVYILDIGGSYKRLCENLGGQYIGLGLTDGLSINPFDLDPNCSDEQRDQKIKLLLGIVEVMTKEEGSRIGRLEQAEIETAIRSVLEQEQEPSLSRLKERLQNHPDPSLKRIGKILEVWCGNSVYGKIVDRKTSISMNRPVVCFDLKGLERHPDLQAVCLMIMTDLIWREVQKDRTKIKFTIFDECWALLESAPTFIEAVFRTFRKYRASAIAISQTIDDFANSKVGPAVLANSSIKWVLRQKGSDQNVLKEVLRLNDREMGHIATLRSEKGNLSEALLIADDLRQVVRIESTPLEYWLATTDPADIAVINDIRQSNQEMSDLDLLKLAAEKFPLGAAA